MPKNKGKGGKNRRRGKNENESAKRELICKEHDQEYGLVKQVLGGNRLLVQCMDGKTRFCIIRGKMRKKVWISTNDYVLVSLRDYEENIGDIIHKYNNDEVRALRNSNEICELDPSHVTDDIMFTHETINDHGSDSDTLPDILEGNHNPNRPIRTANSSDEEEESDDEDDDDSEEDDSDEESESEGENRGLEAIRKQITNLGTDDGNQKVDYSVNTARKPTNTLLEMSKGNISNEESSDDDAKNIQDNADLLQKLSTFRKNIGSERLKKNDKYQWGFYGLEI